MLRAATDSLYASSVGSLTDDALLARLTQAPAIQGAEDGIRAVNDQDRQDQIDWLTSLLQRRGVHGTESQAR
jgi:hypothetical protein